MPEDFLAQWPLAEIQSCTELRVGLNNRSWLVHTSDGVFVLRVYQNTADENRLRFEHELLARLSAAGLPFRVPVPLRTRGNATWATVAAQASVKLASRAVHIDGVRPDTANLRHVYLLGEALAELDVALARISSAAAQPRLSHAAPERVHPLVPEPALAVRRLALPAATEQRMRLTDAEIEALPVLMRLRRCITVLHWLGRWLAGLSPKDDAIRQVDDALDLDDWLHSNATHLTECVAESRGRATSWNP